jgi:hypothetical protein
LRLFAPPSVSRLAVSGLAVLLGVIAFFIVVGAAPLDATNVAWLKHHSTDLRSDDPMQHYLGWAFFRNGPWGFPLGVNPDFGLEVSSSILHSDSIPLLAILAKLFSAWLPASFQYTGIWLLGCFVLQAYFAVRLARLICSDWRVQLPVVVLFLFTPSFLYRLSAHYALCGHWLILAALYLCLRRHVGIARWRWATLILAASLIHPYLLVMVLALWVADLAAGFIRQRLDLRQAGIELLACLTLALVGLWQVGAFVGDSTLGDDGFGLYSMNLLSLLDSNGWSFMLPDIPDSTGNYEGFNLLGLGALLVCVSALIAGLRRQGATATYTGSFRYINIKSCLPLILTLAALTAFAITNDVSFAGYKMHLPISDGLANAASVFRGSGRMFWPVFYCLLLGAVWLLVQRCGARFAAGLLGVAAVLQVIDTSAGWMPLRQGGCRQTVNTAESSLQSGFWNQASRRYRRVRVVPFDPKRTNYTWAYFAASRGLATDAVHLARMSGERVEAAQEATHQAIDQGRFDDGALYVLGEREAARVSQVKRPKDLLVTVDGVHVLAPNWWNRYSPP